MYSYKGEKPIDELPFRIFLSDGSSRTDPSSFTEEEISDAGYVKVGEEPSYDDGIQSLSWDKENITWVLRDLSEEEINKKTEESNAAKWKSVREERDKKIQDVSWMVERYHSEVRLGLEPTDDIVALDTYINTLRNIPSDYSNAEDVVWPVFDNSDENSDENLEES